MTEDSEKRTHVPPQSDKIPENVNQLTGIPENLAGTISEKVEEVVPSTVRKKLKSPLFRQLWIILPYMVISSLFIWYIGINLIYWWIGGLIGFFILDIDHLLDIYFIHPDTEYGKKIIKSVKNTDWKGAWSEMLSTVDQRPQLVMHSLIFEIIVAILGLYVVTSDHTFLGQALILSLMLRIVSEQVREYMHLNNIDTWLWQIKEPIPQNLQAVFLAVGIIVWIIFNLAVLR